MISNGLTPLFECLPDRHPTYFFLLLFLTAAALPNTARASPEEWTSVDIGTPVSPGATMDQAGYTFVGSASGGIGGVSDEFRFVYRRVTGDVDLIARVATLVPGAGASRIGLMLRDSLSADAAHASLLLTGDGSLELQQRIATAFPAAAAHVTAGAGVTWMKLERRGDLVSLFQSDDAVSWRFVGHSVIALPADVYVGLAVASAARVYAVGSFDGITVRLVEVLNRRPEVALIAPVQNALLDAGGALRLAAEASDADGAIASVEFFVNGRLVGVDASAPFSGAWTPPAAGKYWISAVARDGAGAFALSAPRGVTAVAAVSESVVGVAQYLVAFSSRDHETLVDRYIVEVLTWDGTPGGSPVRTGSFAKGRLVDGEAILDISELLVSLPRGAYVVRVTAAGPGGTARSVPSPVFFR